MAILCKDIIIRSVEKIFEIALSLVYYIIYIFQRFGDLTFPNKWGWSDDAMVLGQLPVPGRPTYLE